MSRNDLTKVVFHYADGTKKELDSYELEKWLKFNSLVASCAEQHGMNPPWKDIKWRIIGKGNGPY